MAPSGSQYILSKKLIIFFQIFVNFDSKKIFCFENIFFLIYLVDFSGAWLVSSQFSLSSLQQEPKLELPFLKNRVARGFALLALVLSASASLEQVFRREVPLLFSFQSH